MGLNRSAIMVLMREALRKPFGGNLLTLGKQDVFATQTMFETAAQKMNFRVPSDLSMSLSHKKELANTNLISDKSLFRALGFVNILSMDNSDYEGADCVYDLNSKTLPADLICRFDAIIDGGTLEHIFNIPNVLNNLHNLLKTDGRIIHFAPSSNHIDHGFYMFSPTLFWDYYSANKYNINTLEVFRYTQDLYDGPWDIYKYAPSCLDNVSMGGLDDGLYGIICIATKRDESTGIVVPQQGKYSDKLWTGIDIYDDVSVSENNLRIDQEDNNSLLAIKKKYIKRYYALTYRAMVRLSSWIDRKIKSREVHLKIPQDDPATSKGVKLPVSCRF